jgi:serine/threonine protein kinase
VHGLGRTPNQGYFLAMDLLAGGDLGRRIADGSFSIVEVVRWMRQVTAATAYAHERGVVHCDLKPSNILLDERGDARVTDYGLAVSPAEDLWRPRALAGTPAFMAPEQIDPIWGPLTPRTDVFGLGAVLFALLTGQAPYQGRRTADVLAQAVSGQAVPPPASLRPDVPSEVEAICIHCLTKSPAERFSSAAEVYDALSRLSLNSGGGFQPLHKEDSNMVRSLERMIP